MFSYQGHPQVRPCLEAPIQTQLGRQDRALLGEAGGPAPLGSQCSPSPPMTTCEIGQLTTSTHFAPKAEVAMLEFPVYPIIQLAYNIVA